LLSELLEAVKQCQIRFGGRAELATESHPRVAILCNRIEAALCHGLRSKPLVPKNSSAFRQVTEIVSSLHFGRSPVQEHQVLWHYVCEHLTKHEYERYLLLKQVCTDVGRGRAWLRSSLNEHSLERYLHCMLGSTTHLSIFFEDWAFLLDQEKSSMLPTMAAGLGSILFAISIDNADLNLPSNMPCDAEPLVPSLTQSDPVIADMSCKRKADHRRRKRVPAHIISFDEDNLAEQHVGRQVMSSSAPPTCLNSPASGTANVPISTESVGASVVKVTDSIAKSDVTPTEEQTQNVSLPHCEPCDSSTGRSELSHAVMDSERPSHLQLTHSPQHSSAQVQCSPTTNSPDCTGSKKDTQGHGVSSVLSVKRQVQILTPVNNVSVGELIPVSVTDEAHSEEDSLSVPSYSEDTDCAAAALLATQQLLQTNCIDFSRQEFSTTGNCNNVSDHFTHVSSEIREAVLSLLSCKEELQAEIRSLKRLLDQGQEENAELKAALAETNRQHHDKVERLESRIQALVRENELLKHQLRKYVGAVQMLKRDGTQAHEALASLEASQPKAGDLAYPDYHHEAREYEKKLIQVAEMHGELMEFNDRLHRLLQQKDAALHRLREELVDLRGPLPDDVATSDDDLSVTSDYDTSSLSAAARALVNIWIPSAFLTGGSSDVHHVYQVYIRIRDDEWNIYRRYAQFYSLHKELKKYDAIVSTFDFPPKKTLGNKDARFVEERRRRLQHYLRCVMNHLVQTNVGLATAPDKDLLIGLVPFFGEMWNSVDDRSRRKQPNSRNPFSRLAHSGTENNQTWEHSPQYTGL
jgi:sorting nexin-29